MITDFLRDKSEVRIRLTSLFKAGCLLTFSAFRMGANSRLGAYSNKYGNLFHQKR